MTALVLLTRAAPFLADPARLPRSPDSAWYVWRAKILLVHPPAALAGWKGPTGGAGGGYRVITPLLGALLSRVGGVGGYGLSKILVAGLNTLLVLAVGGAAYRLRRDALTFVVASLFAGALLLWNPFLGYTDNVLALLFLVAALGFLGEGPRGTAVAGVLVFLSAFAHPPAALAFVLAVAGAATLGWPLSRADPARRRSELIAVGALAAALLLAWACWALGAWGAGATLRDAIDPAAASIAELRERLTAWVSMFQPVIVGPLLVVGVVALVRDARLRTDLALRTTLMWLLPALGSLGFLAGLRYPYHRFLNLTIAPVLVAALGLAAVAHRIVGARARLRTAGSVLLLIVVLSAVLAPLWVVGVRAWNRPGAWIPSYLRPPLAAVSAYVERSTDDAPIVFVASTKARGQWGDRRGTGTRLRAVLPAAITEDAFVYVGSVEDFLRRRASSAPAIAELSAATLRDMTRGLSGRRPLAVLIRRWNRDLGNESFLDVGPSSLLEMDLAVLRGPNLARVDPSALRSAYQRGLDERALLATRREAVRPSHLAHVALTVSLLALVPGLLLAGALRRGDLPFALGVAPAASLAVVLLVGFLWLSVARGPVGPAVAWTIVALAVGASAAAFVAGRVQRAREGRRKGGSDRGRAGD